MRGGVRKSKVKQASGEWQEGDQGQTGLPWPPPVRVPQLDTSFLQLTG